MKFLFVEVDSSGVSIDWVVFAITVAILFVVAVMVGTCAGIKSSNETESTRPSRFEQCSQQCQKRGIKKFEQQGWTTDGYLCECR